MLFEDISSRFPNHIRQKVIYEFGGVKQLPNSLEIDYNNTKKMTMIKMMSVSKAIRQHRPLNR
jgi:hypothetical protein